MANNLQIIRLSEQEMIDLWKLKLQLLPVHKNCVIEREDGVDIDKYLKVRIREWYSNLLNTASAEWLPCRDLASQITVDVNSQGVGRVIIPENCIRPIEWDMEEWQSPISTFYMPNEYIAQLQSNRFSRAGIENPVGVIFKNEIKLYCCKSNTLTKAICVAVPEDGYYEFAEVALNSIANLKNIF